MIDTGGMSYPQYVLPAVIVQAMLFGALTTADRAARDQLSGFGVRLRAPSHLRGGAADGPHAVLPVPRGARADRRDRRRIRVRLPDDRRVRLRGALSS